MPPLTAELWRPAGRAGLAIALAVVVDTLTFLALRDHGLQLNAAHLLSFAAASLVSLPLMIPRGGLGFGTRGWLTLAAVLLLAVFLRAGLLGSAERLLGWSALWSIVAAATAGALCNLVGISDHLRAPRNTPEDDERRWRRFLLQIVAYGLLLRFLFLGLPELLYEEAYYWNYAQHLDIGYIDHPPMVAWLIAVTTGLLGDSEFAVRSGAFLCWLLAAWFVYRLSRDLNGSASGERGLLLFAGLPFFFGNGFLMTPDAPLAVCWAAVVYYFYRLLVKDQARAWVGLGLFMGLGLLSKYTIVLLAPAALMFTLLNRSARRWLTRPQPWLAVLLAAAVFSPVVVWNATNEWASFSFQGARRMSGESIFTLPNLIGSILVWLTPLGVAALLPIAADRVRTVSVDDRPRARRGFGLLVLLSLIPLAVFAAFSFTREIRFHWSGTLWLAMLPLLALYMRTPIEGRWQSLCKMSDKAWPPTLVAALALYGAILHYLALGFPGAHLTKAPLLLGWRQLGCEVERMAGEYHARHGVQPWVVGMDRLRTASGLAFYRTVATGCGIDASDTLDAVATTTSSQYFNRQTRMYQRWTPESELRTRPLMMVGGEREALELGLLMPGLRRQGEMGEIELSRDGRAVGRYYYQFVTWQ